jgi:serine/threonine protein kinase
MPEQPPVELVAKLERLGLATSAQLERMGRRVRKLARDVPRFDSVWIDALAQARVLTPFQAAEFNAGRGESLRVGPYLICEKLPQPCYVACYRAKNVEIQEMVRLALIENARQAANLKSEISNRKSPIPSQPPVPRPPPPFINVDVAGDRFYVTEPWIDGRTAAEWMTHHGRFRPEAVLEIARAMLDRLVELEKAGVCHGDVSTSSLILSDAGGITLSLPGLRGVLRPEEGYAHVDLLPAAYDSLAPERITSGTPPNIASDIYACGCVWWQLLCGRPPLPGGNSLAKLRAAQAGGICDVRRFAPDVPPQLAAAISACLEREPSRRPESMAQLAAMLGSSTRSGKEALADCLATAGRPTIHWTTTVRSIRKSNRTPLWLAGAVCCLVAVIAFFWPNHSFRQISPGNGMVAKENGGKKGEGRREKGEREKINRSSHNALTLTLSQRERGPDENQRERGPDVNSPNDNDVNSPDDNVIAASYQTAAEKPRDLILAADKPLTVTSLDLRPGICVRAPSGKRTTVYVPPSGIVVNQEDVRFENIDFVWIKGIKGVRTIYSAQRDANEKNSSDPFSSMTMIQLCAGRAEFRGCSFRCKENGKENRLSAAAEVSAICWRYPNQSENTEISLPNGHIRLEDCFLFGVGVGLDCHTAGALGIEWINTLHLDSGPLVRLDHYPRPDEPLSLALSQSTFRDCGSLLECLAYRIEDPPSEISLQATASVFAPKPGEPLVRLVLEKINNPDGNSSADSDLPGTDRLQGMLRWTGQGSLALSRVPILMLHGSDGQRHTADESSLSIAGLVRSDMGFSGEKSSDPAASRILHWQAPLQSPNPPGIDLAPLPRLDP